MIRNLIAPFGVRFHRQDLAIDTKASNAVFGTEPEGLNQCLGIGQTQAAQLHQGGFPAQAADNFDRRGAKLDGLIAEDTAQPQLIGRLNGGFVVHGFQRRQA
jgi:hypothetical protein